MVDLYSSRIVHYSPFEISYLKNEKELLKQAQPSDYLIVMDERGEQKSSVEFAKLFSSHQTKGTKRVVFFIGAAEGIAALTDFARANRETP